jgi:GT2 family glycosyltransferase
VDDATPFADGAIDRLRTDYPWVELYVNDTNSGPAFSRNFGVQKARCDRIWLLDSDVVLADGAVRGMLELIREKTDLVAIGSGVGVRAVSNDAFQKYKNYVEHCWQPAEGPTRSLDSKSFLLKRSTFLEAGGFSSDFGVPGVEDYEFGYRLLSAKVPLYFTHRAKIYHHHPGFRKQFKLFYARARDWVRLTNKYGQGANDYGTSRSEGALQIVSALIPVSVIGTFFVPALAAAVLALVLAWLYLSRKPLAAMRREGERSLFLLQFFVYSIALSYAVCFGSLVGVLFGLGGRGNTPRRSA